jgi:hypothetical protein
MAKQRYAFKKKEEDRKTAQDLRVVTKQGAHNERVVDKAVREQQLHSFCLPLIHCSGRRCP